MLPRALLTLLLVCATGCASDEEKCQEAKQAAADGWEQYASTVRADGAKAKQTVASTTERMRDVVEPRLSEQAKVAASERHDKTTGAWHRAYSAHFHAACGGDGECTRLRMERREAETLLADVDRILERVTEATKALAGSVEDARRATGAVEDDFDRPSVKSARETAKLAHEACEGLKVEHTEDD